MWKVHSGIESRSLFCPGRLSYLVQILHFLLPSTLEQWRQGGARQVDSRGLYGIAPPGGPTLGHERPGHTLQTTDLIHEAYLKLVDQKKVRWQNRAHFLNYAPRSCRSCATTYRAKRGGSGIDLPLEEGLAVAAEKSDVDLLALDEALTRLAGIDVRQGQIVELRCFSGLSIEETATVLGVSSTTVKDDLNMAKAWLRREIGGGKAR